MKNIAFVATKAILSNIIKIFLPQPPNLSIQRQWSLIRCRSKLRRQKNRCFMRHIQ